MWKLPSTEAAPATQLPLRSMWIVEALFSKTWQPINRCLDNFEHIIFLVDFPEGVKKMSVQF